ncbi:MAG TPA: ATP-binding protein [Allosphingosinicella sp.]|nr:ATP-binding protein [Allosphingosinicella sp.]
MALRHRILAVNIFALAILAGSLFYLDSFRSRLTQARIEQVAAEATMIGRMVGAIAAERRQDLLVRLGRDSKTRIRIYGADGARRLDSWEGAAPTYELRDPAAEPWNRGLARALDNAFDAIVGARRPPLLEEPARDVLAAWPEARRALGERRTVSRLWRAPEGTAFVSAAAPVAGPSGEVLLLTVNARDIRRVVRDERMTLGLVLLATITFSVLLSLFLARTIARPLRILAHAAHRVRLGRDREVNVPMLPARRDEIGRLARALHDMSQALRDRIDATEAFAADVTHELKNPLASLRSAVDSLDRVEDPKLRGQLLDVVRQDVHRLDRLIVEIAETSRLDAELSRARFEPVDLGRLVEALIPVWEQRGAERGVGVAFARPRTGSAVVTGDEARLVRLIDNIVDNAISFSPEGGLVEIVAASANGQVAVSVEDEGRGVAPEARETIFNRFNSDRPAEDFGRHSGLGLAIARAIAKGHDGRIEVSDRHDGGRGARFVARFPAAAS